ncbi:hypothetical protein GCM10025857_24170 [Alicyclobacillus contaminans]|nr:hypothetical protein GCM10025857_24170 [Alicyclobacillus contaminans]
MIRTAKFPLRTKMFCVFMICFSVLLFSAGSLYYLTTRHILIHSAVQQNVQLASEVGSQLAEFQQGEQAMDQMISEKLRIAAIAAEFALNPDAAKVSNQELVRLTKQLGVSDITLLQRKGDDIVGVKSSNPQEIGLSTKRMSGWFQAFNELLNQKPVTVGFGDTAPHFWSGPWANATSNPSQIDKWGYYYDGKTNYIIDPFVETSAVSQYATTIGLDHLIQRILSQSSSLLDVTVFNPKTFGKTPIVYHNDGQTWIDFKNLPTLVGSYNYPNMADDERLIQQTVEKNAPQYEVETLLNQRVLKTFVPIPYGGATYVVGFVSDYGQVTAGLSELMRDNLWIMLLLLTIVAIISFFVSGYVVRPLRHITAQVANLADGNRNALALPTFRNDEIGELAHQVSTATKNFNHFVHEVAATIRDERANAMAFLGLVSSALIHELRNPVTTVNNLLELLPRVSGDKAKSEELIGHIRVAGQQLHTIIGQFTEFLRTGKLHPGPCDLVALVAQAVLHMQPAAEREGVHLSFANRTGEEALWGHMDGEKSRAHWTISLTTRCTPPARRRRPAASPFDCPSEEISWIFTWRTTDLGFPSTPGTTFSFRSTRPSRAALDSVWPLPNSSSRAAADKSRWNPAVPRARCCA